MRGSNIYKIFTLFLVIFLSSSWAQDESEEFAGDAAGEGAGKIVPKVQEQDEISALVQNAIKPTTPRPTEPPLKPIQIEEFTGYAHDFSTGDVTIIDDKTIRIENVIYDGTGPAPWWMVGTSDADSYTEENVDLQGTRIPDEDGSCARLRRYTGETVVLRLPEGKVWTDFTFLSMYCVENNHNFGFIEIPQKSLKGKMPKYKGSSDLLGECGDVLSCDSSERVEAGGCEVNQNPIASGGARPPGVAGPPRQSGGGGLLSGLLSGLGR